MADVGIELAVALDQGGHAFGVIVQRCRQLANLVLGEVRRQLFGPFAAGKPFQPPRQFGHRADHPFRRPHPDDQGQDRKQRHHAHQGIHQLLLAGPFLGDVVGQEEPVLVVLLYRKLVGARAPAVVGIGYFVHAVGQVAPVEGHVAESALAVDDAPDLLEGQADGVVGVFVETLGVIADVLEQRLADQLVFELFAHQHGGHGKQARQPEAEQEKGQDDPAAESPPVAHGLARVGIGDAVTDAVAGLDERLVEGLVHGGPQAVDVHAQGIGVGQFFAPHAGFQLLAGHHRRR